MPSSKISAHDLDSTVIEMVGKSGVKKIQRGSTTEACSVTIEEVVMEKTMVLSVSKGSAGTVDVSGSITMDSVDVAYQSAYSYVYKTSSTSSATSLKADEADYTATIPSHTGTLTSSTPTDLTVKEYSAVLTNSTTLTCDGACEWQVIEFY